MLGASQFNGWVAGPPGSPVAGFGALYQPQVTPGGNCPEMSLVSWVDGTFNARGWTNKMLIDAMGHEDKHVLATNVTRASGPKRSQCKQLSRTVNLDMVGGLLCGFNMSGPKWPKPSFEACGAGCCADERCDHFSTISQRPAKQFDTCAREPPRVGFAATSRTTARCQRPATCTRKAA